jgi:hypothetical protein
MRSPYTVPEAVVTALATLSAGFCGFCAAVGYAGRLDSRLCVLLGIVLGGGSGLAAGVFWCRRMRRTAEREGERGLVSAGAGYGLPAALACTVIVHAGLAVGSQNPSGLRFVPMEAGFALAAGAPLGAIGGFFFRRAAHEAAREARASAKAAPPAPREVP